MYLKNDFVVFVCVENEEECNFPSKIMHMNYKVYTAFCQQ